MNEQQKALIAGIRADLLSTDPMVRIGLGGAERTSAEDVHRITRETVAALSSILPDGETRDSLIAEVRSAEAEAIDGLRIGGAASASRKGNGRVSEEEVHVGAERADAVPHAGSAKPVPAVVRPARTWVAVVVPLALFALFGFGAWFSGRTRGKADAEDSTTAGPPSSGRTAPAEPSAEDPGHDIQGTAATASGSEAAETARKGSVAVSLETRAVLDCGGDWVWGVQISPDGRWLATTSREGGTKVWGTESLTAQGGAAGDLFANFSEDSKSIVTGDNAGQISVETLDPWRPVGSYTCKDIANPLNAWLVGDGSYILTDSFRSASGVGVRTDLQEGSVVHYGGPDARIVCVRVRPTLSVVAGKRGLQVFGDAYPSGVLMQGAYSSGIPEQSVVALSPDSRFITALGTGNQDLGLWSVESGRRLHSWPVASGDVKAVRFTPDGRHVIAAVGDGSLLFWRADSGEKVARVALRAIRSADSLAVSPDGATLVAGEALGSRAAVFRLRISNSNSIDGARDAAGEGRSSEDAAPSPKTDADDAASSRSLSESELIGLSKERLGQLRNAVYARHGLRFRTAANRDYFERQPWYRASKDLVPREELSNLEKANVDLILRLERR